MPALPNHHDLDAEALKRAAQEDPWVMYLVVRKRTPLSESELYQAVAASCQGCVRAYADDPRYQEAFAAWFERSFRKVTLRASESEWARLGEMDGCFAATGGEISVCCLPPRLRSEREPLLEKLQVYNPAHTALGGEEPAPAGQEAMAFVLSPSEMSVGKRAAQVAHAALMILRSPLPDDERYAARFSAWDASGRPLRVLRAEAPAWERLKADYDCVLVRDGGLTEVAPGTETVAALPPGLALDALGLLPLSAPETKPEVAPEVMPEAGTMAGTTVGTQTGATAGSTAGNTVERSAPGFDL